MFRKDRHLSSALLTSEIDYLLAHRTNKRALKREHIQLLEKIEKANAQILRSGEFLAWAFRNWKQMGITQESLTPLTALRIAEHALRISQYDYAGVGNTITLTPTQELAVAYSVKTNFDKAIQQITYSTVSSILSTWEIHRRRIREPSLNLAGQNCMLANHTLSLRGSQGRCECLVRRIFIRILRS